MMAVMPAQAQQETSDHAAYATDSIVCMPPPAAITEDEDSAAMLPWPQRVQAQLSDIVNSRQFEHSQIAVMVYDLTADSVLFSHQAKQQLRPASTMKVITAVTALDVLGSGYLFKTRLSCTGEPIDGTLTGNLYCRGGMDPALSADDLAAMAESVKRMGIDTLRGNVCADLSMKDTKRWGEGWCWDDDNPVLTPLTVGKKDRFLARFCTALREAGVVVCGDTLTAVTPRDAREVCVRTHDIDRILLRMMKNSDNLYAEALFYQTAAAAGQGPATAVRARQETNRIIQRMGLNPADYYVADGSGLSLYNYVTAELEVAFLRYAYGRSSIYGHLLPALPLAGADGTLEKRMTTGFARRNVQAKTGTLQAVSSLAGYLTAGNGHRLCFSIINQGQRKGSTVKPYQDRICEALCAP